MLDSQYSDSTLFDASVFAAWFKVETSHKYPLGVKYGRSAKLDSAPILWCLKLCAVSAGTVSNGVQITLNTVKSIKNYS